MSKKRRILPVKATHILSVSKDDKVIIAFDTNRNKRNLPSGEYPFIYTQNPCNLKLRALRLLNKMDGVEHYINEQYLQSLDSSFWTIKPIKSS